MESDSAACGAYYLLSCAGAFRARRSSGLISFFSRKAERDISLRALPGFIPSESLTLPHHIPVKVSA